MRKPATLLVGFVALVLLAYGCAEIEGGDVDVTTATPPPGSPSPAETEPSASGDATPATEPGSPTAAQTEALQSALEAAADFFGVAIDDGCEPDADCIRSDTASAESAERGIATLTYATAGGGGALVIMGRDSGGEWHLWTLSQGDVPQVVELPGELRACGNAENITIHAEPDAEAEVVGRIAREQTASADTFALTTPGSAEQPGSGWYHVTAPSDGWMSTNDVVNASIPDCASASGDGGPGSVG